MGMICRMDLAWIHTEAAVVRVYLAHLEQMITPERLLCLQATNRGQPPRPQFPVDERFQIKLECVQDAFERIRVELLKLSVFNPWLWDVFRVSPSDLDDEPHLDSRTHSALNSCRIDKPRLLEATVSVGCCDGRSQRETNSPRSCLLTNGRIRYERSDHSPLLEDMDEDRKDRDAAVMEVSLCLVAIGMSSHIQPEEPVT
ncbi:hypothetical protein JOB18_044517 [Solea senegalensis]|uniref:Uncharacterized protein n=1 Tax=Solea senegalensis TaxID=28829 RepID=A0AAV6PKY6_SOLSE|nr:hypothetical protein JOB18_044517 [Solea senegalensis]